MKKFVILFIVLAVALGTAGMAAAQTVPAPGGPFNSAFRVQNLESTVATCSYVFYDAAGTPALTSTPATVAPGDSLYVYVPQLTTLPSNSYSSVVSCDKQIAAVVNFSDNNSGASHSGVDTPALVWYVPGIYDNYYNYYSDVVVQNASTSPNRIQIDIYQAGNTTPVYTDVRDNVPANASVSFSQQGLTQLADRVFYSAKITGTGPIAPIVNIYGGVGSAVDNQLYSFNAFASGALKMYAPVIMNGYYGYDTALVVQNMGTTTTHVKVTYTNGWSSEHDITAGAALPLITPQQTGIPRARTVLYGATIESIASAAFPTPQPIVVVVNQSNAYNRAASYTGFATGAMEVRAPVVSKDYYGYDTAVTCQNVGSGPATMTINYKSGANSYGPSTSTEVPVGGTYLFHQPSDPALSGVAKNWLGSATITANQNIVCVVNQDVTSAQATLIQDSLYSYNGIIP